MPYHRVLIRPALELAEAVGQAGALRVVIDHWDMMPEHLANVDYPQR